MIKIPCKVCSKKFYAKPYFIRTGNAKYCSNTCFHVSRRNGRYVTCSICKKKAYKTQKALRCSKSGKYFCGKSCQTKWRNGYYIREKHPNWVNGESSYRLQLIKSKSLRKCGLCATKDVRVLSVHHIDQNRKNNTLQNLAWLCNNCHFLVHHYEDEKQAFLSRR